VRSLELLNKTLHNFRLLARSQLLTGSKDRSFRIQLLLRGRACDSRSEGGGLGVEGTGGRHGCV
jgi:hypothetical protein